MRRTREEKMPLIQTLMTALSLSAIAGGTWGVERVMDRYGRIPAPTAAAMPAPAREDPEAETEAEADDAVRPNLAD
jgi:hypothetical protein